MSFFSVRCFSGTSRVYRQDGSSIMMKDVRVGDHLLDAYGEFSEVLTFLDHRPDAPDTDYLQISTTESTLEITPTHLLLMRHHHDSNAPKYLQAQRLRVGDSIFSINEIMHLHLSPNLELSLLIILLSLVTHNINLIGFYSH